MSLDDIWTNFCPRYSRKKLNARLVALRKVVDKELTPKGFKEATKWRNSSAFKLLQRDLCQGRVPVHKTEDNDWESVYLMHPEYALYDHEKFKERRESLREAARKDLCRADDDEAAYNAFVKSHPVSYFSHKGYEQWQGSDAQQSLWEDMEANKHLTMRKRDLYGSRREYYEHFPLETFRDNLRQEIKTKKWKYTLQVKGKQFIAS